MGTLVTLIGGLGIGSLLTSIVQWYFQKDAEKKKRTFAEKKEAYVRFLEALHQLALEPTDLNSKKYALWETRLILVGSPGVVRCAQGMKKTDQWTPERTKYLDGLLEEMRKDLGVDVRELGSK